MQPGLLNRPEDVFLGQRGRARVEYGVGLERQLIPGQVLGCERHRLIQIGHGLGIVLIRQAVHQVQVQVVEAGAARHVDGAEGFAVVMDAAQRLQMLGVETLDANRQAVDARQPVVAKLGLLEGAGVGFEGDFDVIGERHALVQRLQKTVEGGGRKQARRTATEEDRRQRPGGQAIECLQVLLQILDQRINVRCFGQCVVTGVRVEVAVGALLYAPGDVDVGRQGRQLQA